MTRLALHPFDLTDKTAFAEAAERACTRTEVPTERGGSIVGEERNGATYFYLYRVDNGGRRCKHYLGLDPTSARAELAERLSAESAAKRLRALGFVAADNDTALTLAVLANGGVFAGGAVLVGTPAQHANTHRTRCHPSRDAARARTHAGR